jgi:hypothetical protein
MPIRILPEEIPIDVVQPVGAVLPPHAQSRCIGERAAADPVLGLDHQGLEAEFERGPRRGEPGGTGADDHQIRVAGDGHPEALLWLALSDRLHARATRPT